MENLIIISKQQITEIITEAVDKAVTSALQVKLLDETVSVNQLVKENTIGGYKKIKKLIQVGLIKTLPDGRISRKEIKNYLENVM